MRKFSTFAALIICTVALGAGNGASRQPTGDAIKGKGCLRAGVEAGCMILTMADKQHKYSLHFDAANKPGVDAMISFEGTSLDVDTCMQGTPVKVSKWAPLKEKCPAETK